MFTVKAMTNEDVPFAVSLAETMDWNLAEGDFEFMIELEPEGCFVLFHDSERAGIVTTVSFGEVAWFGNLVISEECRKKGAGSLLANHAVTYLTNRNVKSVGLYAYVNRVPFYERLGFEYDSDFVVLKGRGFTSPTDARVTKMRKGDVPKIVDYDRSRLGFLREKVLKPILLDSDNLCYLHVENEEMQGFVIAKVYRGMAEVGPLVCDQERGQAALNLLGAVLNKLTSFEVSLCLSQKQEAIASMLKERGFIESFRTARMFHGPPIRDSVCIAESLERG